MVEWSTMAKNGYSNDVSIIPISMVNHLVNDGLVNNG